MRDPMPLKPTTVRFAEDGYEFVQRAAESVGSTVSQFVREAALVRAAWVLNDHDAAKLAKEVRRLARGVDD